MGIMCGEFELPKFEIYTIEFFVTKTNPYALEQGDPMDRLSIKFGPNLRNLSQCCTIYNVPNEDDGQFRWKVEHPMRADRIAFRFEFTSSDPSTATHLVIERGTYEHKEMPDLEEDPNTGRVLSSYVKVLRIDEATGKGQFSKWLSELISAEESKKK